MALLVQNVSDLPYVPYHIYDGTSPTGGNPLEEDLNLYYESGDIAWTLVSAALVVLQIPGFGLFYSGLARRKSALSLLWLTFMASAVVAVQWFIWGYSLSFSHKAGPYIGALDNAAFVNVLAQPSVASYKVPDLLYALYQGVFAELAASIMVGAAAERGRLLPCMIFVFVWTTIIYDPIACWTWNPSGWAYELGALDFAGGGPVHIASGATALAYSYMLGKRTGYGTKEMNYRPHDIRNIVIGTSFLWIGWFGLSSGSTLCASLRTVMAVIVTNLSASIGGATWCLLDYRLERKWSAVGFCSGVVAGLVAITPGCGYVEPWAALIYGFVAGIACNCATRLKFVIKCDDAFDIAAVHAVGGLVGNILTAFFATDYVASLDGYTEITGGFLNHHWMQICYQLAHSMSILFYSLVGSFLILAVINYIPGLRLRVQEEHEAAGIDESQLGESAYDYAEEKPRQAGAQFGTMQLAGPTTRRSSKGIRFPNEYRRPGPPTAKPPFQHNVNEVPSDRSRPLVLLGASF